MAILLLFISIPVFISIPTLADVIDVRFWTAPDSTRVVLDLTVPTQYTDFSTQDSISILLRNTGSKLKREEIEIKDGLIEKIKIREIGCDLLVVLHLMKKTTYHVFSLKAQQYTENLYRPHRVVVDVKRPGARVIEISNEELSALKKQGVKIIVIDPGHGGEDSGAIGRRGTKEKHITLDVAKKLEQKINETKCFRAFLTRRGDYFIPLRKRVEIAEKYGADLFISIHTDSNRKRWKRGTSVYTLSLRGATDRASQLLADRENLADLIGGVPPKENELLTKILFDLTQTATMNESRLVAEIMMKRLGAYLETKELGVKQAGFAVLKSITIPSVLVEVAFISNRWDERLLRSNRFREKVATALFHSICEYFGLEHPLPEKKEKKTHIVERGETLWRIAQKYGVSVWALKKANGLGRSNIISIGQKLVIPIQ
jgi:N-acetylmuramoyl-L-alanine amidase